MVDAKSIDEPLCNHLQNQPVAVIEHPWPLDAETDQAVDCEKAPVVQLLLRAAPVLEPVVLPLEEHVESGGVVLDPVGVKILQRVRRDGEELVVVADGESIAVALEAQRAAGELATVSIVEHAQHDLVPDIRGRGFPVDVEIARVVA